MVQLTGLANSGQTAAIPLYQKGFDWIKFWLGFCFATCLCLLLAAAITFLVLYILAQTGVIKSIKTNNPIGRLVDKYSKGPDDSNIAISSIDHEAAIVKDPNSIEKNINIHPKFNHKYFVDKLLSYKKLNA